VTIFRASDVAPDRDRFPALFLNCRDGFQAPIVVDVEPCHSRAHLGKANANSPPYAGRCARDQGHLTFEGEQFPGTLLYRFLRRVHVLQPKLFTTEITGDHQTNPVPLCSLW
jgi:hypothetical protein